jgi:hypothetical protein
LKYSGHIEDNKMQESKPNSMLEFLKNENDYITYLLEAFEVPETINSELPCQHWKTFKLIT